MKVSGAKWKVDLVGYEESEKFISISGPPLQRVTNPPQQKTIPTEPMDIATTSPSSSDIEEVDPQDESTLLHLWKIGFEKAKDTLCSSSITLKNLPQIYHNNETAIKEMLGKCKLKHSPYGITNNGNIVNLTFLSKVFAIQAMNDIIKSKFKHKPEFLKTEFRLSETKFPHQVFFAHQNHQIGMPKTRTKVIIASLSIDLASGRDIVDMSFSFQDQTIQLKNESTPVAFANKITRILSNNTGSSNATTQSAKVVLISESWLKMKVFLDWISQVVPSHVTQLETLVVGIYIFCLTPNKAPNTSEDQSLNYHLKQLKENSHDCTFRSAAMDDIVNLILKRYPQQVNFQTAFKGGDQTVSWNDLKFKSKSLVPCYLLLETTIQSINLQYQLGKDLGTIKMSDSPKVDQDIYSFKDGLLKLQDKLQTRLEEKLLCTTSNWLVTSSIWKYGMDAGLPDFIKQNFVGAIDLKVFKKYKFEAKSECYQVLAYPLPELFKSVLKEDCCPKDNNYMPAFVRLMETQLQSQLAMFQHMESFDNIMTFGTGPITELSSKLHDVHINSKCCYDVIVNVANQPLPEDDLLLINSTASNFVPLALTFNESTNGFALNLFHNNSQETRLAQNEYLCDYVTAKPSPNNISVLPRFRSKINGSLGIFFRKQAKWNNFHSTVKVSNTEKERFYNNATEFKDVAQSLFCFDIQTFKVDDELVGANFCIFDHNQRIPTLNHSYMISGQMWDSKICPSKEVVKDHLCYNVIKPFLQFFEKNNIKNAAIISYRSYAALQVLLDLSKMKSQYHEEMLKVIKMVGDIRWLYQDHPSIDGINQSWSQLVNKVLDRDDCKYVNNLVDVTTIMSKVVTKYQRENNNDLSKGFVGFDNLMSLENEHVKVVINCNRPPAPVQPQTSIVDNELLRTLREKVDQNISIPKAAMSLVYLDFQFIPTKRSKQRTMITSISIFCPDSSLNKSCTIKAIQPSNDLHKDDWNDSFKLIGKGRWVLNEDYSTTPDQVSDFHEARDTLKKYIGKLKTELPQNKLVLCYWYASYENYVRTILPRMKEDFSGWCDLYTILSCNIHQRPVVIKAPFEDIRVINGMKKYFLPNHQGSITNYSAQSMYEVMDPSLEIESIQKPFYLDRATKFLNIFVQVDTVKLDNDEVVITRMAVFIPDDNDSSMVLFVKPMRHQEKMFKTVKGFTHSNQRGWTHIDGDKTRKCKPIQEVVAILIKQLKGIKEKKKADGLVLLGLNLHCGFPLVIKAILEHSLDHEFLKSIMGVCDLSYQISQKEKKPNPLSMSELEEKLSGAKYANLKAMTCRNLSKAAHNIWASTLGNHPINFYAHPMFSTYTSVALHQTQYDIFLNNYEIRLNQNIFVPRGHNGAQEVGVMLRGFLFENNDPIQLALKPVTSGILQFKSMKKYVRKNQIISLEVNIRDFEGEIPQGTLVGFAKVPDGKSDESAMQVEIQESLANEVESMPSPAYSSLSDVSICSPEYLDSQSNVPKPSSSSLRKSQSENKNQQHQPVDINPSSKPSKKPVRAGKDPRRSKLEMQQLFAPDKILPSPKEVPSQKQDKKDDNSRKAKRFKETRVQPQEPFASNSTHPDPLPSTSKVEDTPIRESFVPLNREDPEFKIHRKKLDAIYSDKDSSCFVEIWDYYIGVCLRLGSEPTMLDGYQIMGILSGNDFEDSDKFKLALGSIKYRPSDEDLKTWLDDNLLIDESDKHFNILFHIVKLITSSERDKNEKTSNNTVEEVTQPKLVALADLNVSNL